ncbi:MAG: hypothetical protein GY770_08030 [Aestuariibacter sp.]|nr:hypothetical protein [Aestuariibacter sp.]
MIIQTAPQYSCLIRMYLSFEVLAPSIKTIQLFLCRSCDLLPVSSMTIDEDIIREAERTSWSLKLIRSNTNGVDIEEYRPILEGDLV